MKSMFSLVLVIALFASCTSTSVPETKHHSDYHFTSVDRAALEQQEMVYVPIYSDIYYVDSKHTFSLTATLSIRNTSFKDSIYVFSIDYYNSTGQKVRRYNESTLLLKPMESIEFVVEWGARQGAQKPFLQGIMIGTTGQQGISFTTEGIVVEK